MSAQTKHFVASAGCLASGGVLLQGLVLAAGLLLAVSAGAQVATTFDYKDPTQPDAVIKLEAFVYEPQRSNGKTILMSHGSTGGKKEAIGQSIQYVRLGKMLSQEGYRVVTYMRKGRGKSEGVFVEESGRCDRRSLDNELADAYPQIAQMVQHVRTKYGADKLILMGHSRGGFLSSYFAARHPDLVLGAVNLAGAWSAVCETRNRGFGREMFDHSASKFKNQFWAYFENDSYFAPDRFNDPNYEWLSGTAGKYGLAFKKFPANGMPDGHSTPTFKPETWGPDVMPWLSGLK